MLAEFIQGRINTPFNWGSNDCCLFAADAVQVMTGHDYASAFRGRYRSEFGAARALKRCGAGDLLTTVTAQLGQPIAPAFAHRGDVVMTDFNGTRAVGVLFNGEAWSPGERGAVAVPRDAIIHAWRVG